MPETTVRVRSDAQSQWAGREAVVVRAKERRQGRRPAGQRRFDFWLSIDGQDAGWFYEAELELLPDSPAGGKATA